MRTTTLIHPAPSTRLDRYHTEAFLTMQGLINSDKRPYFEIAAAAGVCSNTISKWASGDVAFTRDSTMAKVAKLYGYKLVLVPMRGLRPH